MRLFVVLIAVAALQGCALLSGGLSIEGMKEQRQLLWNPQRINESADKTTRAYSAEQVQVNAYYAALAHAKTNYEVKPAVRGTPESVMDYVEEGIALNTAYCRRWFHRVDDASRQFQWGGKDLNIITALGTTALGLLDASAKAVAVYGAATTAAAGFSDNYNQALLTAPGAKNVESKVMQMMNSYGAQLRVDAQRMRFAEAFTRLEAMADICTYSSIRDVVNSSLTATEAQVSPSGTITSTVVSSSFQKDDSGERILAYWMPNNAVDVEHATRIQNWMAANNVRASVAFFARSKLYESARKQAIVDLNIPETK